MRLTKDVRVLVTKPETFLGRNIIAELKKWNIKNVISDIGDLRERDDVIHNMKELAPDIVIHPRNVNFVPLDTSDSEHIAAQSLNDITESVNLAEALLQSSVSRFVTFAPATTPCLSVYHNEWAIVAFWKSLHPLLQAQGCRSQLYMAGQLYGDGMNYDLATGDFLAVCMQLLRDAVVSSSSVQLPCLEFDRNRNYWLPLSHVRWFAQWLVNDLGEELMEDHVPLVIRNAPSQYSMMFHTQLDAPSSPLSLTKLLARISGYDPDEDWFEGHTDNDLPPTRSGMTLKMVMNLENDLREIYNRHFCEESTAAAVI